MKESKEYRQFISPAVKALLEKYELSFSILSDIQPTGKLGRVTKADILKYISERTDSLEDIGNIEKEKIEKRNILHGELVLLRALEYDDIDLLYKWENDSELWEVSNTIAPFSKAILKEYISASKYDIYTTKQLRLIIERQDTRESVGMIDLFDFDPFHRRAGVGVFVQKISQSEGYASEALVLLKDYAKIVLGLHQLYCNIQQNNKKSLNLFKKQGFVLKAVKRDWLYSANGWEDELFLQCIM